MSDVQMADTVATDVNGGTMNDDRERSSSTESTTTTTTRRRTTRSSLRQQTKSTTNELVPFAQTSTAATSHNRSRSHSADGGNRDGVTTPPAANANDDTTAQLRTPPVRRSFEGATTRSISGSTLLLTPYSDREIRIGSGYQANVIPIDEWKAPMNDDQLMDDKSVCVWSLPDENCIDDEQLEEFCTMAFAQYNYNIEQVCTVDLYAYRFQSLGILHWHKFDIDQALIDMKQYTPINEQWSTEDRVLFEQAYINYGKNFTKIRQMVPHRSLATIVDHYYLWKKTKGYSSYMDREKDSDESDGEDVDTCEVGECENCAQKVRKLTRSDGGNMCTACTIYHRRNGTNRPCNKGDANGQSRKGWRCPSGFDKSAEEIRNAVQELSKQMQSNETELLQKAEQQLDQLNVKVISARGKTYRAEADINRQYNQCGLANGIDSYRIPGRLKIRPNQRWTEEERMLCVHAFRRYGKDMQAIAEMIGTKSLEMVREFYREYQQKYRLDYLIEQCNEERTKTKNEVDLKSLLGGPKIDFVDLIDD